MERLGIFIFVFYFLGICFFERVRSQGDSGTIWQVVFRNLAVLLLAMGSFFFLGIDVVFPPAQHEEEWFKTARSIIAYEPYGEAVPGARVARFMQVWLECLFCATATLIVAAGIWDLKLPAWAKWSMTGGFCLLVYPLFGRLQGAHGLLGQSGFYDHAGALLVWALPASFVTGARLLAAQPILPDERKYHLKGVKILPGMKQRFFLGRGIGFTMIFLVLSTTTLVNLPLENDNPRMLWIVSKTLTLIPASFTILFCNFLFYGLFGRKQPERSTYAPPIFAVMTALVSTQACNQYGMQQAAFVAAMVTFIGLLYLRLIPLEVRYWDSVCSIPLFLLGGVSGVLLASLTPSAGWFTQFTGVLVCLGFGGLPGFIGARILQRFAPVREAEKKNAVAESPQ